MPSKLRVAESKASNAKITIETAPRTAVFVGATAGIGKATLTRLVAQKTAIKVYVIERNAKKQQAFVNQLRESNSKANVIFLEGEVSLMAEVKRICNDIKARESSLDALVLSAGYIPFGGRQKTSEGIDVFSALVYYGRLLFILHLLPLLKASNNNPRIVNVGGAANETENIFLDDLDLEQPGHYSFANLISHVATAMTVSLSRVAEENPEIVFISNFPGRVATDIFSTGWGDKWYSPYGKALVGAMQPLVKILSLSPEDAGERTLYMLTSAGFGGKGVPLQDGDSSALTMKKTKSGALFCINTKLEGIQKDSVMTKLQSQDAGNKIWARVQAVLEPYL